MMTSMLTVKNIVAGEQLTKIVVALAILVSVSLIDLLDRCLKMIGIDVARGHNLAVRKRKQVFRVARTLPAHANNAYIDAIVRRGCR